MKTKILIVLVLVAGLIAGCVKDELFKDKPVISSLIISPQAPLANSPVDVIAVVTDPDGLTSVKLYYKIGTGSFTAVAMTSLSSIPNAWGAQIPGQADGVSVNYYVEAVNNSGKKAFSPEGAPSITSIYTIGAPLILMNEIYSRGTIEAPDWIEIYNTSNVPANISGYLIYDNGGQTGTKPKMAIPANTIIPPKGFFVIVVDDGSATGFGLSSAGEQVWLENNKGNIIDNVTFPAMETTQSYGRKTDGGLPWQLLNTITRGTPNSSADPIPSLFINEVFSQGTTANPDWVEIYNASTFSADISNWKIYDDGGQGGTKPKLAFPAGSIIPAKGFLVIVVDVATTGGFGLSSTGEQIWFENLAGSVVDNVTFPALSITQSYGRFPDGTSNWQILNTVTKGAANSNAGPTVIKVVMNEIFSRGIAGNPDWIEIYNDSNIPVDISGWLIYDSGGQTGTKPKMAFPANTIIPSKGFFVIVVDDGTAAGFGLSSTGEQVWFEKSDGTILDTVTFPALTETQSYGRKPDGSDAWQILNTITRGTSNN